MYILTIEYARLLILFFIFSNALCINLFNYKNICIIFCIQYLFEKYFIEFILRMWKLKIEEFILSICQHIKFDEILIYHLYDFQSRKLEKAYIYLLIWFIFCLFFFFFSSRIFIRLDIYLLLLSDDYLKKDLISISFILNFNHSLLCSFTPKEVWNYSLSRITSVRLAPTLLETACTRHRIITFYLSLLSSPS